MPRRSGRRRLVLALALVLVLATASGCSQRRVVAHTGDPAQVPHEVRTHHQYLWGLLGEPNIYVRDCPSHALYDVEVSTSFWQGLATVLTLGIWMPATVEWRCATVDTQSSDAPIPGVADDGGDGDAHR